MGFGACKKAWHFQNHDLEINALSLQGLIGLYLHGILWVVTEWICYLYVTKQNKETCKLAQNPHCRQNAFWESMESHMIHPHEWLSATASFDGHDREMEENKSLPILQALHSWITAHGQAATVTTWCIFFLGLIEKPLEMLVFTPLLYSLLMGYSWVSCRRLSAQELLLMHGFARSAEKLFCKIIQGSFITIWGMVKMRMCRTKEICKVRRD